MRSFGTVSPKVHSFELSQRTPDRHFSSAILGTFGELKLPQTVHGVRFRYDTIAREAILRNIDNDEASHYCDASCVSMYPTA